ncbi:S24 family peptidase [Pseudoalteromonas luteoviolacea]|uniref:LexA family protein n=1 Tax=Pseudoalteromonas luteoviolacea TaxID=43657 RepID=UPI001F3F7771|nr:S24 family peptidase [Pseudoalteromonas luteoviolacea]MCF6442525.1 S24 family peptidase [Pseudoalteromonas luteoviolacea]
MKVIPIKASAGITGFGHGAAEYTEIEQGIDSLVMPNAGATFIGMASGSSMQGVGIFDGDLLIIDRSTRPQEGDVIVASYNREFVCKILDFKNGRLLSASPEYPPVQINDCDDFSFEGVVTSSVRMFRAGRLFKSRLS